MQSKEDKIPDNYTVNQYHTREPLNRKLFIWMNQQQEEGSPMDATTFDILMILAFGTVAGTGLGLIAGFVTRQQKSDWSEMTRKEQIISISLVIVFITICSAGLGYYYFLYSGFS
jgi:NhaP-type Na+/H+ or K+/H+ antiporter